MNSYSIRFHAELKVVLASSLVQGLDDFAVGDLKSNLADDLHALLGSGFFVTFGFGEHSQLQVQTTLSPWTTAQDDAAWKCICAGIRQA